MRKQQSLKIDNSWNFFLEPSYYLKLLFTLNTDNRSMEQFIWIKPWFVLLILILILLDYLINDFTTLSAHNKN